MTKIFDFIIEKTNKAKNKWINFQRKCWVFQEMLIQIRGVYTDSKGFEQSYRKEELNKLAVYARLVASPTSGRILCSKIILLGMSTYVTLST